MSKNEIKIGDKASISKVILEEDVLQFAQISGDKNPLHIDENYAKNSLFKGKIVHGLLVASYISAVIANKLPGEGSIYLSQSLNFLKPVRIGDKVTAEVEILNIKNNIVTLRTTCFKNKDIEVISGEAVIMISKVV